MLRVSRPIAASVASNSGTSRSGPYRVTKRWCQSANATIWGVTHHSAVAAQAASSSRDARTTMWASAATSRLSGRSTRQMLSARSRAVVNAWSRAGSPTGWWSASARSRRSRASGAVRAWSRPILVSRWPRGSLVMSSGNRSVSRKPPRTSSTRAARTTGSGTGQRRITVLATSKPAAPPMHIPMISWLASVARAVTRRVRHWCSRLPPRWTTRLLAVSRSRLTTSGSASRTSPSFASQAPLVLVRAR
jgi:hypothetical protein